MLVLARVLASAPYSSLPRACNALQISLSIPAFLTRTFTCGTPVLGKEPKKASEAHLLAVKTRKDFLPKAAPFKNERTINIEQLAKLYTHERKRFAVLGELEIDHVELVGALLGVRLIWEAADSFLTHQERRSRSSSTRDNRLRRLSRNSSPN